MTHAIDLASGIGQLVSVAIPLAQCYSESKSFWDPDEQPGTVVFGDFANVVGESQHGLSPSELRSIFEIMENLLVNGDEEVQASVATGFLETLLHMSDEGKSSPSLFVPLLGEESKEYCRAWNKFSGCTTEGLDGCTKKKVMGSGSVFVREYCRWLENAINSGAWPPED